MKLKDLKYKFLVELNVEKAAEKYMGRVMLRILYLRNTQIQVESMIMGQDAHLFLPYNFQEQITNVCIDHKIRYNSHRRVKLDIGIINE